VKLPDVVTTSMLEADVTLVGAGPGAADLLTVRALRAIQSAQIVVYDALVSPEVLDLIPATSRKIEVGKRGHRLSTGQDFINRLMMRLAKSGTKIVRLKGGDPSVFGRAAEERAFLENAGLRVEVVPGITTASAAAAQFGFSLTKRGAAQKILFATGRTAFGAEGDWAAAADPSATLCLYMGCADSAATVTHLLTLGRAPTTPALLALNVGRPDARMILTTLTQLPDVVAHHVGRAPGFIVIGEVCLDARDNSGYIDQLHAQLTPSQHRA
jgi:uroporphyrin-III C-methyltransferase